MCVCEEVGAVESGTEAERRAVSAAGRGRCEKAAEGLCQGVNSRGGSGVWGNEGAGKEPGKALYELVRFVPHLTIEQGSR